jgi:hypothetical protein
MLSILQNQWVVGIGVSIIGGVIVLLITRGLFGHKDNTKHIEQVNLANAEIIRTLRPYVVEEGLPHKDIVNSILASTARKYNLQQTEVYSIRVVCEELIKEALENVYVPCSKKQEYSRNINNYILEIEKPLNEAELVDSKIIQIELTSVQEKNEYRERYRTYLSTILSTFVVIMTALILYITPMFIKDGDLIDIVFIASSLTLGMLVAITLAIFISRMREKIKK